MVTLLRIAGVLSLIALVPIPVYRIINNLTARTRIDGVEFVYWSALYPVVGIVLAVLCFALAHYIARQDKLVASIADAQRRAAARRANAARRPPSDMPVPEPNRYARRYESPRVLVRPAIHNPVTTTPPPTMPGRDVQMQEIPLPDRRKNRELPGR